jgi:hypothetical protein
MNQHTTKFFNSDEVYISSRMNEYLKNNFGYEISGDLASLREAKASLEVTKMELKDEYMSAKYVENMLMIETIKSLLKAHGPDSNTSIIKEDSDPVKEELELGDTAEDMAKGLGMSMDEFWELAESVGIDQYGGLTKDNYEDVMNHIADNADRYKQIGIFRKAGEFDESEEEKKIMSSEGDYEFGKDMSKDISFVTYKGKVISQGDFDQGADGWFMNINGKKGQEFFSKPSDVVAYFSKHNITEEVETVNEGDYANDQHEKLEYVHSVLQDCGDGNMDITMVEQAIEYVEDIREQHFDADGSTKSESVTEDEEEKGPEHYRYVNDSQLSRVQDRLRLTISELDHAIQYRAKNSHLFFNTGDKAGTGDLYGIKEKLEKIDDEWDDQTELYGM